MPLTFAVFIAIFIYELVEDRKYWKNKNK